MIKFSSFIVFVTFFIIGFNSCTKSTKLKPIVTELFDTPQLRVTDNGDYVFPPTIEVSEEIINISNQELIKLKYNLESLGIKAFEDSLSYLIYYFPLDYNMLGGDAWVKISKENLNVVGVLRGQ